MSHVHITYLRARMYAVYVIPCPETYLAWSLDSETGETLEIVATITNDRNSNLFYARGSWFGSRHGESYYFLQKFVQGRDTVCGRHIANMYLSCSHVSCTFYMFYILN